MSRLLPILVVASALAILAGVQRSAGRSPAVQGAFIEQPGVVYEKAYRSCYQQALSTGQGSALALPAALVGGTTLAGRRAASAGCDAGSNAAQARLSDRVPVAVVPAGSP